VLTFLFALLLSFVLVKLYSPLAPTWIVGQIIAFSLTGWGAFLVLKRTLKGQLGKCRIFTIPDLRSYPELYSFAAPLAAAAVFIWMQNYSYRIIVERFAGAELLGYLGVGMGIASSLAAVAESLIQQVYFPGFYKKINSSVAAERLGALQCLANTAIPIYIVLTFFTVSTSYQLTRLLVSHAFGNVATFIVFGILIEFMRMVTNIIAAAAHSEMSTKVLIKPYFIGGALAVILVFVGADQQYNELLIPVGLIISGLVSFLFVKLEISRLINVKIYSHATRNSLLFSIAFLPVLTFRQYDSLEASLIILSCAGAYMGIIIYMISSKWARIPLGNDSPQRSDSETAFNSGSNLL